MASKMTTRFEKALEHLNTLPQTPLVPHRESVDKELVYGDQNWLAFNPLRLEMQKEFWAEDTAKKIRNFQDRLVDHISDGILEYTTPMHRNDMVYFIWGTLNFIWLKCFESATLNGVEFESATMEAMIWSRVGVSRFDTIYLRSGSRLIHREYPDIVRANIYYMLARVFQALPDEPEGFLQLATDTPSVKSANKA
jgi:hypothetical protein